MAMTQGEAVFQAVTQVFGNDAKVPPTSEWTPAQKESVNGTVFMMFKNGETAHSSSPDDAALKKYIPGLVNNWVRKDPRLNGGTKYTAKRPGSRTGSGDEMLKAMKMLLSTATDETTRKEIQTEIDKRIQELKPKTVIDVSKLPENLRHLAHQQ